MMQSVQELEKVDKEIDEEDRLGLEEEDKEEDDTEGEEDEEDEEDGDNEEQEGTDVRDNEVEEEAIPDKTEENIKSSVKPKEKKQSEGLNLNNEVVKMRKEMKKVRVLIIRKLTRQIAMLKKKKGKEAELEKNQKRAARLLEEIHALKDLLPDQVTKTALQKNLNFEQVCKNPKSTISDRAVARLATHPQFSKKIEIIKAAVKAFREERMKDGKQARKEKVQNKPEKATPQSIEKVAERKGVRKEDITEENEKITDKEEGDGILKDTTEASNDELEKESEIKSCLADAADGQRKKMPEPKTAQDIPKDKSPSKNAARKPSLKSSPAEVQKEEEEEEESDFESSDDEEKEYFDDSTEERFHKRSSQSEESEGDDDFFIGKVSRFKKKKKKGAQEEKGQEVKVDPTDEVQGELDELESRLKSKAMPLQSVFCSLSAPQSGGGRGAGRGRGGDKFRGRGKPRVDSGINRDFGKQFKFEKWDKGAKLNSGSKYEKSESSEKGFSPVGRGRGRGRGGQTDRRGGGVFSHQKPQQALHPSWEASKKRKEQQGQILAFQGKKIKFDDDD